MNGHNFSKKNKNIQSKNGQVLLLVVMVLATVLTIVLTMVFASRTETKISKLEQDSERSLVAAEAGVEAAIQQAGTGNFTFRDLNLDNLQGIDTVNSTVKVENPFISSFTSPTIPRDQQYTVYLAPYNGDGTFGTGKQGDLTVYYGDTTDCNSIALEFTVISGDAPDYTVQRYVADTSGMLGTVGGTDIGQQAGKVDVNAGIGGSGKVTFSCKTGTPISIPDNGKLMFVRVLGVGNSVATKIGINNSNLGNVYSLPVQGRYITAEAKTKTGIVKKVQLFQSYPQIPSQFFVTGFGQTGSPT